MIATRHLLVGSVTASLVASGLVGLSAGTATAATTYKACANKKTGAMRLVVKGKKCKKNEKKLKWNVTGPPGANGATGPIGPAGAFQALDQTKKVIGDYMGVFSGVYPMVRLSSGAIIVWQNDPTMTNAMIITAPQVYFREAGCSGEGYGVASGMFFDAGIIISGSGAAGAPVYRLQPGTPQTFTAQSILTPGGCVPGPAGVSNAYVAKPAGEVPVVAPPLYIEPKS